MQIVQITLTALSLVLSVQAGNSGWKPVPNPPCIPQGGNKGSTCQSLSNGGLLNLNLFGCSSNDFSPVIVLKKRAMGEVEVATLEERGDSKSKPAPPKMVCWGPTQPQQSAYCQSASNAGLINLNFFGCSSNDFSPTIIL